MEREHKQITKLMDDMTRSAKMVGDDVAKELAASQLSLSRAYIARLEAETHLLQTKRRLFPWQVASWGALAIALFALAAAVRLHGP